MTITFYAAPTSNCRRVAIALQELELPFVVRLIDRAGGEQHQPEFRQINPAGMVPVIVDPAGPRGRDGLPVPIAQSGAILIYLAQKTGRLLPFAGAERIVAIQWLMHVLSDINATVSAVFHARRAGASPDSAVIAMFEQRLHTYLGDCSKALDNNQYLAGTLSLADFALYPLVASHESFLSRRPDLAALLEWQSRMAVRPAVVRGMNALS